MGGAVYGYTCSDILHTLHVHTSIVCKLDAGFLNGRNSYLLICACTWNLCYSVPV